MNIDNVDDSPFLFFNSLNKCFDKNNGAFIFVSIVSSHTFSETSLILVG